MKRYLTTAFILLALFIISSCTVNSGSGHDSMQTQSNNSLKITPVSIVRSEGNAGAKPGEGKVFVGVLFEIENISDKDQFISSSLSFSAYADDSQLIYSAAAAAAFEQHPDGMLPAYGKITGYFALEAPADAKVIKIVAGNALMGDQTIEFRFNMPQAASGED